MESKFKVGDVVQMKSGGLYMIILSLETTNSNGKILFHGRYYCGWFDNDGYKQNRDQNFRGPEELKIPPFPEEALMKVGS